MISRFCLGAAVIVFQLQSLVSGCAGTNLRIPLNHGRCCCQAAATPVNRAANGTGELEAAEEAADAAAREARRVVGEKRKAELHAGVDERVGKLKEKLHVS